MATLFENIRIFTGDTFIEQGHVLISNGTITSVGSGPCPNVPTDAKRLSYPHSTLLPGLIDSHVHGLYGNTRTLEESLRFGITTVMDMHNEPKHIATLRSLAASDPSRYSDFKAAGVGATVPSGWPTPVVLSHGATPEAKATVASWPTLASPADAETFVERQIKESGAEYIKIMHEVGDTLQLNNLPRPDPEIWRAVVEAAHKKGLKVVGHAYSWAGARELLEVAGVDGLTHVWLDRAGQDPEVTAEAAKRTGAHCNPTLSGAASQTAQGAELREKFAADPLAQKMLCDPSPREALGFANNKADIENVYASTRALYKAGVPLIVGSDASGQKRGQAYGLTVHMEMWQMVHRIGMKPVEVLKAATSLIADLFRFEDRGRIEMGRRADLVLVEGDVREVLADPKKMCLPVRGVWRGGVLAAAYDEAA